VDRSILNSVKRMCSVDPSLTVFDDVIAMHTNSAFARLHELGVGPVDGFMIEDAEPTWGDFLGDDPRFNQVKSYVYLYVRILFDPPQTGYLVTAMEKQIEKLEWTINVVREGDTWIDPSLPAA